MGFDCASRREIHDIMNIADEQPANILYANPHKTLQDCELARDLGIERTVVDSPEEVERIAKSGWKPDILVRLAVDDHASRSPFSIKFGTERSAWHDVIRSIYKNRLTFCGLSFHIGSGAKDPQQFSRAIDTCRLFTDTMKLKPDVIDIGGGFMPSTFTECAKQIKYAKTTWEQTSTPLPFEWIAEPGRFFSSQSHTLYVPIIARKRGPKGHGWRYIIDESIYGQFTCIPFDHASPHWLHVPSALSSEPSSLSSSISSTQEKGLIFGRTCDSIDLIAYSENMPVMEEGEWLVFPEMGAYTTSSASEFNGFPKPCTYYQEDGWIQHSPQNSSVVFPVEAKSSIQLHLE